MSEASWTAVTLVIVGLGVVLVFASNYSLPGNAVVPSRTSKPMAYWGNIVFFGGIALFGAYALLVGF
jgi:hypothetical protein